MTRSRDDIMEEIHLNKYFLKKYKEESKYNPYNQQLREKIRKFEKKIKALKLEYNSLFDEEMKRGEI